MPAKEIKELRVSGKLDEAYTLAKKELDEAMSRLVSPDGGSDLPSSVNSNLLWAKRNISWVFHEFLKVNCSSEKYDAFLKSLVAIKDLQLPAEETMLFDSVSWQVGKMCYGLLKSQTPDINKILSLFELIKLFHFTKPSESYSFLFKALHKALKDNDNYLQFVAWWDLKNFRPEDYQMEKMPNGKEVMALAEQAYISHSKHLLPKQLSSGETIFHKDSVMAFMPMLDNIIESYPQYQYPAYFKAKLLLALGDKDTILSTLLPFARKKRNDFWVWDILSEIFSTDKEKVFACYCRALSCNSPEEMLVNLRQRMAAQLIQKGLFNEAKTEIEFLVKSRQFKGFKIPNEVVNWQNQEWYQKAIKNSSNADLYKKFNDFAEGLMFGDIAEENVIVEFVNTDRKILNFIASENKFGFFKYERFIKKVNIGDILKVRFESNDSIGLYKVFTVARTSNDDFKSQYLKEVEGNVRISEGRPFGFINDIFIPPSTVLKFKLQNELAIKGLAIRTFNKEKKNWGWKLIEIT